MSDDKPQPKLSDWELAKEISHVKKTEAGALRKLEDARKNDNNYKDGREVMSADHQHEMEKIKLRELIREKGSREAAGNYKPTPPSNAKVEDAKFEASKKKKPASPQPRTSSVDEKHAMFFDLSSMLPKNRR
ncbi:hypothetical protein [Methylobacterium sp. 285MFTsu5.1]|uniref:hypothetical protein n=1 Tax=Methylobacterium sp. 285MFTsu5.1 TaxID=1172187 RepID=UPI001319FD31|nr:hypothetical protein [Methylobacterium sp. 285MFTsu5.1]